MRNVNFTMEQVLSVFTQQVAIVGGTVWAAEHETKPERPQAPGCCEKGKGCCDAARTARSSS